MYNIDRPGITGYSNTITISNSKFWNTNARKKAGAIYINNNYVTSTIFSNVEFKNSNALDGNGGIINVEGFNGMMTI